MTILFAGLLTIAGIIRPGSDGQWYLLRDKTHTPLWADHARQTTEYIEVSYRRLCEKVISATVTPDDKLAQAGIVPGPSVRLESIRIFLGQNGNPVEPSAMKDPSSAIFFTVLCTKGEQ